MASQFYRRYIPPSKPSISDTAQQPPLKKQKTDTDGKGRKKKNIKESNSESKISSPDTETTKESPTNHANGGNSLNDFSRDKNKAPKRKEKHSRKDDAQTNGSVDVETTESPDIETSKRESEVTDDLKHLSVRSKYVAAVSSSAAKPSAADQPELDALPEPEYHGLEPLPQPAPADMYADVDAASALPQWLRNPVIVPLSESVPVSDLSLSQATIQTLEDKGYKDAFAIQASVLPMLLRGPKRHRGDICISAATGSGKTLAYTLPILEDIREKPVTRLRGLIIVPTRELVSQVRASFDVVGSKTGIKVGTAVGSKAFSEEQDLLVEKGQRYDPKAYEAENQKTISPEEELLNWNFDEILGPKGTDDIEGYVIDYSSKVDVLICTPGRLVEHIESTRGFTLEHVEWLVIDEADRLLDENFQQWISIVLPQLEKTKQLDRREEAFFRTHRIPHQRNVRKIILSATMTRDISKIMSLKLSNPKLITLGNHLANMQNTEGNSAIEGDANLQLPATLDESALPLPDVENKPLYLIRLIETILPEVELASENKARMSSQMDNHQDSESGEHDGFTSSSPSDSESSSSEDMPQSPHQSRARLPASSTFGVLIFVNNNENALRLTRLISLLRPEWSSQISSMTKSSSSSSGRKILRKFQKRELSILIASDRASRGLDIANLSHILNYDVPTSLTSYVHRVGRTARAGRQGQAITLLGYHEARWFWNEIAKSPVVARTADKKVKRMEKMAVPSKEDRDAYAKALERLGDEARSGL